MTTPTTSRAPAADPAAAPSPRQPCPCGSGKRYKLCHGRGAGAASALVLRPFEGLPGETDWVALREVVPAATATVRTSAAGASHGIPAGTEVTIASVLPGAVPGLRRAGGELVVALQTSVSSGDASRDAAAALLRTWAAEPGTALESAGLPGPGPRLQDLLDDTRLSLVLHADYGFWAVDDTSDLGDEARRALDDASASVEPVEAVPGVTSAYWTRIAGRELLRWVLPQEEQALLDALARVAAASGGLALLPGSRFLGAFRTHGLGVPVWDLPAGTGAAGLAEPAADFSGRLDAALALSGPLSDAERRARAGIVSRQLTLR